MPNVPRLLLLLHSWRSRPDRPVPVPATRSGRSASGSRSSRRTPRRRARRRAAPPCRRWPRSTSGRPGRRRRPARGPGVDGRRRGRGRAGSVKTRSSSPTWGAITPPGRVGAPPRRGSVREVPGPLDGTCSQRDPRQRAKVERRQRTDPDRGRAGRERQARRRGIAGNSAKVYAAAERVAGSRLDAELRAAALQAMVALDGTAAQPTVLAWLGERDRALRCGAMRALAELAEGLCLEHSRAGLDDPETNVRAQAIEPGPVEPRGDDRAREAARRRAGTPEVHDPRLPARSLGSRARVRAGCLAALGRDDPGPARDRSCGRRRCRGRRRRSRV
jgi:hypothetical protein